MLPVLLCRQVVLVESKIPPSTDTKGDLCGATPTQFPTSPHCNRICCAHEVFSKHRIPTSRIGLRFQSNRLSGFLGLMP